MAPTVNDIEKNVCICVCVCMYVCVYMCVYASIIGWTVHKGKRDVLKLYIIANKLLYFILTCLFGYIHQYS